MFSRIFDSQAKTINSAALTVAIFSLVSRILGLFRDRILAGIFGAGPELDVYYAAFRIPDFIYNILIAGGVVVAFLPLFSDYFLKDKEMAWRFASNVLNIFLFSLILIALGLFVFAPAIVKIIVPGFDNQQIQLTVLLTKILLLSPILLGLSSVFSGILQYFNKFLFYSLAPILYNLGIILGIIFLTPHFGIAGAALGVITGALLHFLIQVPGAIRSGFSYKLIFDFKDEKIKRVFSLMIPRTLGVAAPQINLMVATVLASTLAAGSLAIFNFANNFQQFPMGLIGIPFAVAIFPSLSKSFAALNREDFINNFFATFRKIAYLTVPISILIFIFRNQIIEIIFKTGKFTQNSIEITAACLGFFALGIWANSLIPLVLRAFFAFKDTKTPTIIAVFAMVLNVGLSFLFVRLLNSVAGLPLAFSIDSILQLLLLMFFLNLKIKNGFSSN